MSRAPSGLTVAILRDESAWRELQPEWQALYEACPHAGPPLHAAWLDAWWCSYGSAYAADDGLRIVTGRADGHLVAAAPLYLTRRRGWLRLAELRPLSTGEDEHEETCADYLAPLALDGRLEPFLHGLADHLASGAFGRVDRLAWPSVQQPAALCSALAGARTASQGDCFLLDLSGGYESYLQRLSRETRRKSRRLLKEMESSRLEFELAANTPAMLAFFDELVVLHQARWQADGQPGCYAAERFRAFHRALTERLVPRRELVMARLRYQGRTLAVIQGFRHGRKLDFYQSGVVLDAGEVTRNAGVTCYLACLRELAEDGVEEADFLLGDAIYKQRQSTDRRPLWTVSAACSWRGRLAEGWATRRAGA